MSQKLLATIDIFKNGCSIRTTKRFSVAIPELLIKAAEEISLAIIEEKLKRERKQKKGNGPA